MYIGKQQIIGEKLLDGGFVEVTLKALELDDIGETETVVYNEADLENLKSEEPENDLTKLREIRVEPIVQDLLLCLFKHNMQLIDLEYITQTLVTSLNSAQDKHERNLYGNHAMKRNIHQFKDSLMG